ncbi:uncharacterized protein LOC127378411 [Dicentrarchus labrax]|uniref:uncharacterized protein LOC127378411 n=1 Tax=Dicentrarchus labrax TaxID=13489 RepID=UPI0021F51761|nr:uncharacterized protein LOC127378411 [Dicentrarchus labrax]
MDKWKLWFVLLPLCLCINTEEAIVKTIGSGPDVTSICAAATLHIITLIVCKIRTETSGGEGCRLLYQHGQDFVHECDSRFTLRTNNQTMFLHLTNLTTEDSGNYTCECSHFRGTDTLHLILTVKGEKEASNSLKMLIYTALISSGTAVVIITGVVLGFILRKQSYRDKTRSGPSVLSVSESTCSLDKDDPDNTYTSLQQPASDLYQTMSSVPHQHGIVINSETDPIGEIYEIMETKRQ